MGEKVRIRSADGYLFETTSEVACISPLIADLLHLHGDEDEIPLPAVQAHTLSQILELFERYNASRRWDVTLLRHVCKTGPELERLAWAANYLSLERLLGLCLAHLAQLVKERGHVNAHVSVNAIRKTLGLHLMSLPADVLAALIDGLGHKAEREDADALAAIRKHLDHESIVVRKAAIDAVSAVSPFDDMSSIEDLTIRCAEDNSEIQLAALSGLSRLSTRGNTAAIEVMQRKSHDGEAPTRRAAVEAVGRIAVAGDPCSIAVVRRALADPNGSVRTAAVEALVQLSRKGDPRAVLDVISSLEDMDEQVRHAAAQAVEALASAHDGVAVLALSGLLEHRYWWVSSAAAKALRAIAGQNGKNTNLIVDAVLPRLGHQSAGTRRAAMAVLVEVASASNGRIISVLGSLMQHHDKGVREGAAHALVRLGKGEHAAIKVASSLLEHPEEKVRIIALRALEHLAIRGDDKALEELSRHLKHFRSEVRQIALSAIVQSCNRNDPIAIEAICRSWLDRDSKVQELAAVAFERVVDQGHPHALFVLLGLLDVGGDRQALRKTIRILPNVAGGSDLATDLVCLLLERQSAIVRSVLFDELMQVVDSKYRQCTFALCDCWMRGTGNANHDIEDKENAPPVANRGTVDNFQSPLEGGMQHADVESQKKGSRAATRALSTCLLQPWLPFPWAISVALQLAGVCGDHVASELKTVMNRPRWFLQWQSVESCCSRAFMSNNPSAGFSMAKARIARRQKGSPKCTHDPPCLHRSDCPHIIECRRAPKRARIGGA